MRSTKIALALASGCFLALLGCKPKTTDEQTDFNKRPILENLADNYILPGYNQLATDVNALESTWNTFLASQTVGNLNAAQSAWLTANISFQRVKAFDFGPAMEQGLLSALGTFPADTVQIATNISAGTYNLLTADNIDAVGFDALDFLLFKANALAELQASANSRTYVSDVISKMKTEVLAVKNGWTTYRTTFIDGISTASTAPFAQLVNTFCRDFELSKTAKIGIPIGMQSLGILQPVYLEARRSGEGKSLLLASLESSKRIFNGMSLDGSMNKTGFDDYLSAIEKSSLANTINTRLDYLIATPNTWSETIEQRMNSNNASLIDYYNYMQGTVVFMKTDMASAFGVLITYQDNDGD